MGSGEGWREGSVGCAVEIDERVADGVTESVEDGSGAHVAHVALVEEEGLSFVVWKGKGATTEEAKKGVESEEEREKGRSDDSGDDREYKIHSFHVVVFFFFFLLVR